MEREHVLAFLGVGPVKLMIGGRWYIGKLQAHDPLESPHGLLVLLPLMAYSTRGDTIAGYPRPFSTDDVARIEKV